ncbi:MAG: hypothetical protein ACTHLE_14275 [Agriterribacter sp.]
MLSEISWYNYVIYSFSVIGVYYSYILFVYYRKDFCSLLSRKKRGSKKSDSGLEHQKELVKGKNAHNNPEVLEQLFSQAMILSEAIKSIFQEISFQDGTKEELFVMLRKKIKDYPSLQATPFRVAIQNLIQTEASKYQIDLDSDQKAITALWAGGE